MEEKKLIYLYAGSARNCDIFMKTRPPKAKIKRLRLGFNDDTLRGYRYTEFVIVLGPDWIEYLQEPIRYIWPYILLDDTNTLTTIIHQPE